VANDQSQVVHIQNLLGKPVVASPPYSTNIPFGSGPALNVDSRLERDQHQLAQATTHLTQVVHQLAQAGSIQAAQRATDSHELLVDSAIALGVVALLAVLAGWLIAGRMLQPIRTITRTARRISSTSLHERLALDGPPDELKELGDTLDGLFARLEGAFDAQSETRWTRRPPRTATRE
jgi:nitrate/nitrite-specific signal transduction histidine kinase